MRPLLCFVLLLLAITVNAQPVTGVPASQLPVATNAAGNDLMVVYKYPFGSASTRQLTISNLLNSLSLLPGWNDAIGGAAATNVYELTVTGTGLNLTTNSLLYTMSLNAALAALATNNASGLTNFTGSAGGIATNAGTGYNNILTNLTTSTNASSSWALTVNGDVRVNGITSIRQPLLVDSLATVGLLSVEGQASIGDDLIISGTAIGDGGGLTNLPTDTKPWVHISAKSVLHGTAVVENDGMDFGPDTPGTTTGGWQEAIDSFSRGSSNNPAGVYLKPSIGTHFYTNTIAYSNNWPYQFVVQGAGRFGTRLVYAGTAQGTNTIDIKGGGNASPALNCSGDNMWQDLTIASVYCPTNVLLRITNANATIIRRVNFSSWDATSGIDWMSSVASYQDSFNYSTTTNGLVGLVSGNINNWGLVLDEVQPGFLAVGVVSHDDHLYVNHFLSVINGNNGNSQEHTAWPTNHPYRLGAGIIRYPKLDATYKGLHFYADKTGIALMNHPGSGNTEIQNIDGILYEGGSPALIAINTNGNTWAINDPSGGSFQFGVGGRINTNDFSQYATASWLLMRGVIYNDPAELKRPSATGGFNLISGDFSGSARGATNIPGLTPLPRQSLSTNSFVMVNSGTNNLDGIWFWNSTSTRYTNAARTGVAALVDDFSSPPTMFMTFTNSAFQLPDYLLTATFTEVSNALHHWLDLNQDTSPGVFGYFSGSTNSETLISGRAQDLKLLTSFGTSTALDAVSVHVVSQSGVHSVSLPDIRTNAGRLVAVKNGGEFSTTTITPVASQLIEGASSYVISNPYDGVILEAVNGQWFIVSRTTLAPNGNGAGLTNIQEVALNWWGTNPPAGQILGSTSSNTPAWFTAAQLGITGGGGGGPQAGYLTNGSGVVTANGHLRTLSNSVPYLTLDWDSELLYTLGGDISLDWFNRRLHGQWTATNLVGAFHGNGAGLSNVPPIGLNPILWWPCSDGSGATITALAGPNGTYNGDWITRPGESGALSLNGSSDYAQSASSVTYGTNVLTLSFWMYAPNSGTYVLAESSAHVGLNDGTFMVQAGGTLEIHIQNGGLGRYSIPPPLANSWVHMLIVLDSSSSSAVPKVYVNNKAQTVSTLSNARTTTINYTAQTFNLGARDGSSLFYQNYLDDVRIYPGDLSTNTAVIMNPRGGQTPVISDVEGTGFNLTNFSTITATNLVARSGFIGNGAGITNISVADSRVVINCAADGTNYNWDALLYNEAYVLLTNNGILNITALPTNNVLRRLVKIQRTSTNLGQLYTTNSNIHFGQDIQAINIGPATNSGAWVNFTWNALTNRLEVTGNTTGY